jgi:hypothetical protein
MDLTRFQKVGITIDSAFHNLNKRFNPRYMTWAYGRGLEQASGMGFWFIAATMAYGGGYGFNAETISVNNFLWAWLSMCLGFCQIYYTGTLQRLVFNLMATAGWVTIAMAAFIETGGWNLLTAISLPYCLCSFYVYGFLLGEK